jgi:hypothetical protein
MIPCHATVSRSCLCPSARTNPSGLEAPKVEFLRFFPGKRGMETVLVRNLPIHPTIRVGEPLRFRYVDQRFGEWCVPNRTLAAVRTCHVFYFHVCDLGNAQSVFVAASFVVDRKALRLEGQEEGRHEGIQAKDEDPQRMDKGNMQTRHLTWMSKKD